MTRLGDSVHSRLALVCAGGALLGGCDRDAAQVADGRIVSDQVVEAVAAVGDVNGDGSPDLALSCPVCTTEGGVNAGRVVVALGGQPGDVAVDDALTIDGEAGAGDGAGGGELGAWGVTGVGDVDGDGTDDLAVASMNDVALFLGPLSTSMLASGAAVAWVPVIRETTQWLPSVSAAGDTAGAARAYLDAFSASQTGPLAGQSLVKLGQALGKLGQGPEACVTLAEVGKRFPGSADQTAAQAAMAAQGCP